MSWNMELVGGYIEYAGEKVLLKLTTVEVDEKWNKVKLTFADENGDTINNTFDLNHQGGKVALSIAVRHLSKGQVRGSINEGILKSLIGGYIRFDINESEPTEDGKTYFNLGYSYDSEDSPEPQTADDGPVFDPNNDADPF